MMRHHKRQAFTLVLVLGVVALVAQLAGVGSHQAGSTGGRGGRTLATIPGGSVPDIGSTTLAKRSIRLDADETLRMRATARLRAVRAGRGTQAVCGIRYWRRGDRAWTLGTPYETVTLPRSGKARKVTIVRSIEAPAADRYELRLACHVSAPGKGAKVRATGSLTTHRGLPDGAATPTS